MSSEFSMDTASGSPANGNPTVELDATPQENKDRRERLEWQIRRVEERMAEVEARLASPGEASE